MKKYLHNSDEMFESPQYGWEQMQFLLEENLPQKKTNPARKFWAHCMIAASFIAILLFSSLVTGEMDPVHFFQNSIAGTQVNTPGTGKSKAVKLAMVQQVAGAARHAKPIPVLYVKNTTDKNTGTGDIAPGEQTGVNNAAVLPPASFKHEARLSVSPVATTSQQAGGILIKNTIEQTFNNGTGKDPAGTHARTGAVKNTNSKRGSWNLSAGLAVNAMIGREQNLRPYPTAELRYNVTGKWFLSLGLGAGSPVATASRGIEKTAFLNDTTNNVLFYNSSKRYSRLSYADIPLMAGVKISKRISLQGGVQASVLLNAKNKTSIEPYNFQMSVTGEYPDLAAGNAVSENYYTVKERKIDYRLIAGFKYTIHKTSFNVIYQYAPRAPLEGDHVSHNKNQLLTLNAQFRIK